MKVLKTILSVISILGILGQLGQIGTPANQAGVFGVMFFWLFILIVSIFGNKQIGNKPKKQHSSIITVTVGVIVGLGVIVALTFIYDSVTADSAQKPISTTKQAQLPVVEEKPASKVTVTPEGIVEEINEYRLSVGKQPLEIAQGLADSAKVKCNDLIGTPDENGISRTDFEHTNSETGVAGLDFAQLYFPNATFWGENLANGLWNTDKEFVQAWLDSPTHKENIDRDFKYTGVAICTGGDSEAIKSEYTVKTAVQHFAK